MWIRVLLVVSFFLIMIGVLNVREHQTPKDDKSVSIPMTQCETSNESQESLKKSSAEILKRGTENATLYELKTNETFKNINDKLLANNNVSDAVKKAIHDKTHDYYAFSYYSDGLKIKGYISIPLTAQDAIPVIILLRGGNRLFGLPIPGELSTHPGYSVISTTYRGGVSQGKDEFGGKDVDDVINLFDHLPLLEKELNIKFHEKNKYMLGLSRGGMQLFLSLNRYPELQKKISKVASISGLLNLEQAIQDRADFKDMLVEEFGLTNDEAGKKWIHYRNPVDNISQISRRLPILIAQGTQDTRVCLKEGLDMLLALRNNGHAVTYVEIEGGDHVLSNTPDFKDVLFDWLESDNKK